jgi:hypothetical protein
MQCSFNFEMGVRIYLDSNTQKKNCLKKARNVKRKFLKSEIRRSAAQMIQEQSNLIKQFIANVDSKLNEEMIRWHVLYLLGEEKSLDVPVVIQARIAWEQLAEITSGKAHPHIEKAREIVATLKERLK